MLEDCVTVLPFQKTAVGLLLYCLFVSFSQTVVQDCKPFCSLQNNAVNLYVFVLRFESFFLASVLFLMYNILMRGTGNA